MCGIIAYIGAISGIDMALGGIQILQNRGYDSCGICDEHMNVHKYASKADKSGVISVIEHQQEYIDSRILILHTRWATSGAITDANAHPHTDSKNRVALVHNGIIENYQALRQFLQTKYKFKSETDTEVIAMLIGHYLDEQYTFQDALKQCIKALHGTWGLAIIYQNQLYLCKNGSPLIVGYEKNFALIASESSALLNHVKNYFIIDDGEILSIKLNNNEIEITHNHQVVQPLNYFQICSTDTELAEYRKNNGNAIIQTTPYPFQHWMLKEIMEQPESLLRTLNMGGRLYNDYEVKLGGLSQNTADLLRIRHLLIIACGTSRHAGLLGSKYLKMLEVFDSIQVLDASEFSLKDIPKPYNTTGMLVLSQSGETKDVHKAMEIASQANLYIFAIVNVVGSLIARESACGVYLNAGREVGVASTKSFTSQTLAILLIGLWYSHHLNTKKQLRKEFIGAIRKLPQDCKTLLETLNDICTPIIPILVNAPSIFILGRDLAEPIAYEGALKIKEISYIHAEGYPSGSLKHGPFALIQKGTPIILIMLDDEHSDKIEIAAEEVHTRGAKTILITNKKVHNHIYDYILEIPDSRFLSAILAVIPLQYISYLMALELGHNPDFPRNLAKVVTVE